MASRREKALMMETLKNMVELKGLMTVECSNTKGFFVALNAVRFSEVSGVDIFERLVSTMFREFDHDFKRVHCEDEPRELNAIAWRAGAKDALPRNYKIIAYVKAVMH
jgi:hypothetical protein